MYNVSSFVILDLTAGFDNETLYEAVIGQSYRCNSSQSLVYEKYVASADGFTSLTHQHLKTEAFRDTNTTIYSTGKHVLGMIFCVLFLSVRRLSL